MTHAAVYTGRCLKCQQDLDKVEKDDLLKGIARFSIENQMDILMGYDNPCNTHFPVPDLGKVMPDIAYYDQNATILESSLIALNHMQVDVCFLRGSTGLANSERISLVSHNIY